MSENFHPQKHEATVLPTAERLAARRHLCFDTLEGK
jgi:hypothetical protein